MSSDDAGREDEHSAFAWIMSGTIGAVVVGGLAKTLLDRRRAQALEAGEAEEAAAAADDEAEAEGHPS